MGAAPKDAGMTALKRIKSNTIEKHLLNDRGEPNFNVNFYVVNKAGEHAGVSLYGGPNVTYAFCDEHGANTIAMDALLSGQA